MPDLTILQTSDHLDMRIAYASSTEHYIGEATPGTATSAASWRIKRRTLDSSGRTIRIELAGNSNQFDQVWDNRASLTYGP